MTYLVERLPGFRNVLLVHDSIGLDMDRVMEALDRLTPDRAFPGRRAPHRDRVLPGAVRAGIPILL